MNNDMFNNYKDVYNEIIKINKNNNVNNDNNYNILSLIDLSSKNYIANNCKKLYNIKNNNIKLKTYIKYFYNYYQKQCNNCRTYMIDHIFCYLIKNKNIKLEYNIFLNIYKSDSKYFINYQSKTNNYIITNNFEKTRGNTSFSKRKKDKIIFSEKNNSDMIMFIFCTKCNKILSKIIKLDNKYIKINLYDYLFILSKDISNNNLSDFLINNITKRKEIKRKTLFKSTNSDIREIIKSKSKNENIKRTTNPCLHINKLRAIKYKKIMLTIQITDISFYNLINFNDQLSYYDNKKEYFDNKYLGLVTFKNNTITKLKDIDLYINLFDINNISNNEKNIFINFKLQLSNYIELVNEISEDNCVTDCLTLKVLNKIANNIIKKSFLLFNELNNILNIVNKYKDNNSELSLSVFNIINYIDNEEYLNNNNSENSLNNDNSLMIKNIFFDNILIFKNYFYINIEDNEYTKLKIIKNNLINNYSIYLKSNYYKNNVIKIFNNNKENIIINNIIDISKKDQIIDKLKASLNYKSIDHKLISNNKYKQIISNFNINIHDYYPLQFYILRRFLNINENEFILNLNNSINFNSDGGKTNSLFYTSFDNKYICKSISQIEFEMFKSDCLSYINWLLNNIKNNKLTIISRIVGLFSINKKKIIIMENLYYGIKNAGDNIITYDLKGGEINRFKFPKNNSSTRLDFNFKLEQIGDPFYIKSNKIDILNIIKTDLEYLKTSKIIDYSLLVLIDRESKCIRIGIIDYLRKYDLVKKIESKFKEFTKNARPTIINPEDYYLRLYNFIKNNFYFYN